MHRAIIVTILLIVGNVYTNAQGVEVIKKTVVFSAIKGILSKRDTIALPITANSFKLVNGDTAGFTISLTNKKLILAFKPAAQFVGIARAQLQVQNKFGKAIAEIDIAALSTNGLEGENEPPLYKVADVLGYQINIGWATLANHSRPELQGEEVSSSLFRKAAKGKVEMIPVARYSPDFELPFGYYIDKADGPGKQQVGVLAKAGEYPEHQTLFPAIATGTDSFDPGSNDFGFYATGPTHTAWSEDVWNMLFYPANAVRATRIYPLKDKAGKTLKNEYLLCFEEAKNGDYNDYVFVVKNIIPVTSDFFTPLFNGKSLDGWHTFLKGIGNNADPGNNFKIENGALHVSGKELGYAITEKPYSNYHLKVDFKWGEKKWPPRENAKRDGGICYNIPVNEPDSIWPKSIECQVQEGDTGDFWLLGFSTIKVDGKTNTPMNHAQVVKKNDGEKPTGQWNTVEVISYNGRCVHIVNGLVVNFGEDASVKDGRILLQSEYSEIFYKNVKLRKL